MKDGIAKRRQVALVLDTELGEGLNEIVAMMPVWIIASPVNHAAVEALRTGRASVTTLLPMPAESSADTFWRAIYDIEDHHGDATPEPYEVLVVYGIAPDLVSADLLRELMLEMSTSSQGRFELTKAQLSQEK